MAEEVTHEYHETHRMRTLGGFGNSTCIGCRACSCHQTDMLKKACKRQLLPDDDYIPAENLIRKPGDLKDVAKRVMIQLTEAQYQDLLRRATDEEMDIQTFAVMTLGLSQLDEDSEPSGDGSGG